MVLLQMSVHQRDVGLPHLALRKHLCQPCMCSVVARHNDQPARLFIQPMHNPRPLIAAYRRERPIAMQQRVHQRTAFAIHRTGSRMHRHPCGFVDDRQLLVLINDVERNIFSKGLQWRRRWIAEHFDRLAALQSIRRPRRRAPDADLPLFQQQLHALAADAIYLSGKPRIQALFSCLFRNRIRNCHSYD